MSDSQPNAVLHSLTVMGAGVSDRNSNQVGLPEAQRPGESHQQQRELHHQAELSPAGVIRPNEALPSAHTQTTHSSGAMATASAPPPGSDSIQTVNGNTGAMTIARCHNPSNDVVNTVPEPEQRAQVPTFDNAVGVG